MNIEQFLTETVETYGYIGIFFLMILNGAFNFPPSQALYVITAGLCAAGHLDFSATVAAGITGNIIGNYLLFVSMKKRGLERYKKTKWIKEDKKELLRIAFGEKGSLIVFFGNFIFGAKVIVPILAAMGGMKWKVFLANMSLASLVWVSLVAILGDYYYRNYNTTFGLISILIIQGVVIFLCGWFWKYLKKIKMEVEL